MIDIDIYTWSKNNEITIVDEDEDVCLIYDRMKLNNQNSESLLGIHLEMNNEWFLNWHLDMLKVIVLHKYTSTTKTRVTWITDSYSLSEHFSNSL